jgi:hypothetical protein
VEQVVDGDEIALALGHLAAFDLQESVVHPHARHALHAERAAALGELVLVVREHEVDAAAVDVEGVAQMLARHGRALDVPARPAGGLAMPQGLGQAGSPGLDGFHSTKSMGSRL